MILNKFNNHELKVKNNGLSFHKITNVKLILLLNYITY